MYRFLVDANAKQLTLDIFSEERFFVVQVLLTVTKILKYPCFSPSACLLAPIVLQ